MRILAPKVYRVDLYDRKTGALKETIAAKGIPKPSWDSLASGKPIAWKSIAGVKRAGRGRFFSRIVQTRTVTANTGRRIADGDNLTRAPKIEEVEP
jgi:hypothetical protein